MRSIARTPVAGLAALLALTVSIRGDGMQTRPARPRVDPGRTAISGQVLDATTGRPLAGAVVTLIRGLERWESRMPSILRRPPQQVSVISRADGRFTFRNIRPGAHAVEAVKPGYVPGAYGRRRPFGASRSVQVTAGEQATISISIWKFAAITGTVADEAGEAVVGQDVCAVQRLFFGGRRHLRVIATARTDDRGIYRIANLPPGEYLITPPIKQQAAPASLYAGLGALIPGSVAVPVGAVMHVIESTSAVPPISSATGRLLIYPSIFHPAAPTAAQATPVVLGAGDERVGVDFQFLPIPGARISGRAFEALPGPPVTLRVFPAGWDDVGEAVVAEALGDDKGAFTFPAVPPGDYVLKATSDTASELRWASVPVSVGQQDVAGVEFVLQPALRISGRIELDGSTPRSVRQSDLLVSAEAADGSDVSVGPERVSDAGRFTLDRLAAGRYVIRVGGIPEGWMLRSVMQDVRDVSDVPLMLAGSVADLIVTLSDRVTEVVGTVRTAASAPDPDALVLIFSADPDTWRDSGATPRRTRAVRPNSAGEFSITGLPTGEYYVVAIPDEEMGDGSPSMYAAFARGAEVVRLAEGAKRDVALTVRTRTSKR